MKKIVKGIAVILLMEVVLVCFSGCNIFKKHKKSNDAVINSNGDTEYTKEFGSYTVKSGWIESKTHSTKTKFFYVKDGEDNEKKPNNISINQGKNKYSKDQHLQFKDAITKQLAAQTKGSKNATINASGSTTKNGYTLYTFILKSNDSTATQYYIVGEKKYVMIYETVWADKDGTEADEVAHQMNDTFKWND